MIVLHSTVAPAFVDLTITEAVAAFDPPVSEDRLRLLVRAMAVQPCGQRRNGHAGRPEATYDARVLMKLHALLVRPLEPPS